MKFREIIPGEIPTREMYQYLIGCIGPRPIAFASTINTEGRPNLAPYSYFNAFSSNPPVVAFSSNLRALDHTEKDTLKNIKETKEVVINMVSYSIIRQMALASVEYPNDVDEFVKSGLTPIPSDLVKPFRVKESPASLECKVRDIIALGSKGGAGNLIICDVLKLHISEAVIGENNRIDPHKIALMGRLGRSYYVRASGDAVMAVIQPITKLCIGMDQLPESVRTSPVLSGNELAMMAGIEKLPEPSEIQSFIDTVPIKQWIANGKTSKEDWHLLARESLESHPEDRAGALKLAMIPDYLKNEKENTYFLFS